MLLFKRKLMITIKNMVVNGILKIYVFTWNKQEEKPPQKNVGMRSRISSTFLLKVFKQSSSMISIALNYMDMIS